MLTRHLLDKILYILKNQYLTSIPNEITKTKGYITEEKFTTQTTNIEGFR